MQHLVTLMRLVQLVIISISFTTVGCDWNRSLEGQAQLPPVAVSQERDAESKKRQDAVPDIYKPGFSVDEIIKKDQENARARLVAAENAFFKHLQGTWNANLTEQEDIGKFLERQEAKGRRICNDEDQATTDEEKKLRSSTAIFVIRDREVQLSGAMVQEPLTLKLAYGAENDPSLAVATAKFVGNKGNKIEIGVMSPEDPIGNGTWIFTGSWVQTTPQSVETSWFLEATKVSDDVTGFGSN